MFYVSSFRIDREKVAQFLKHIGEFETYDQVNDAIVKDPEVPCEAQQCFKRKYFQHHYTVNGVDVMVVWIDTLAYLISPQRYPTVRDI